MSMYVIIVINLLTGIFFSSIWFSLDHSLNHSLAHSQKNDQENDQLWSFMRIACSSWWKTCSTWWKICVVPKCSIRTCSNSYMFKFHRGGDWSMIGEEGGRPIQSWKSQIGLVCPGWIHWTVLALQLLYLQNILIEKEAGNSSIW